MNAVKGTLHCNKTGGAGPTLYKGITKLRLLEVQICRFNTKKKVFSKLRIFIFVARISKYDFWNPGEILDLYG